MYTVYSFVSNTQSNESHIFKQIQKTYYDTSNNNLNAHYKGDIVTRLYVGRISHTSI